MRRLKLIWDFRGPSSLRTAEHHVVHLKDFIKRSELKFDIAGVESINEMHNLAYMVVEESEMIAVRDALKPHRGQLYQD